MFCSLSKIQYTAPQSTKDRLAYSSASQNTRTPAATCRWCRVRKHKGDGCFCPLQKLDSTNDSMPARQEKTTASSKSCPRTNHTPEYMHKKTKVPQGSLLTMHGEQPAFRQACPHTRRVWSPHRAAVKFMLQISKKQTTASFGRVRPDANN